MNTYIDTLRAGALTTLSSIPEEKKDIGILTVKKANEAMREASLRPNPEPLWLTLWFSGEVCCCFSDSGAGKSIYAVQISNQIAESQKVLYFDFELSGKQFQLRYTSEDGRLFHFPENLYRVELNPESLDTTDFENAVISSIEDTALSIGAKVLVIDNLTYLCLSAEKGDAAGALMMRLMGLKKKYGWSILVLAHTPKRSLTNPITQNDLAGSKRLYNFFDSVFAIGKSAQDNGIRYVKQIKVRHGEYTYDSDNVIIASIEKEGDFLRFTHIGHGTEKEHLKEPSDSDKTELIGRVKALSSSGKSIREIAKDLNISKSKVGRLING